MKQLFKKVILITLCFSLFACAKTQSAEQSVISMLESYKQQKWSEASSYFEEKEIFENMQFAEDDDEVMKQYEKTLFTKMCDINYTINSVKEEGSSATVNITISSLNVGDKFLEGILDVYTFTLSEGNKYDSNEQIQENILKLLEDALNTCTRTIEKTIDIQLEKNDENKWIIQENIDLVNTMMGELLESIDLLQ